MRRRRSRYRVARPVVQSFKKVLNYAPTSTAAGQTNYAIATGVDSTAAGQTSATDVDVPTGAVLKSITIQFAAINLVSVAAFLHVTIQHIHSGQGSVAPNAVGGNPMRNQIHYQNLYTISPDQNNNVRITFKIPQKYQRIREGDQWMWIINLDQITTQAAQIIYKFYR